MNEKAKRDKEKKKCWKEGRVKRMKYEGRKMKEGYKVKEKKYGKRKKVNRWSLLYLIFILTFC